MILAIIGLILGIILGGELLDAAGMFLAVPCIVVFKHVIEDIHRSSVKILSSQQQKHHRYHKISPFSIL